MGRKKGPRGFDRDAIARAALGAPSPVNIDTSTWAKSTNTIERKVAELYNDEMVENLSNLLEPFSDDEARQRFPDEIRCWAAGWLGFLEFEMPFDPALKKTLHEQFRRLNEAAKEFDAAYRNLSDSGQSILHESMTIKNISLESEGGLLNKFPEKDISASTSRMREAILLCRVVGESAEHISKGYAPKRGRPRSSRWANKIAMRALQIVYFESTGHWPTRRWDPYRGQFYGPFIEFAVATMRPIQPSATENTVAKLMTK